MSSRIIDTRILKEALGTHVNEKLGAIKQSSVRLSIDSRLIEPNDVFLAIRGEFNDGHSYINSALAKGARLIIAEISYAKTLDQSALPSVVFVENSLQVLADIARLHLEKLSLKKIAITGSNGKTTTKEMVKAALISVLGADQVYASSGNKNNHFGVPLSALEVEPHHKLAIFEMGMNHPGEIQSLCAIVKPDMGVITNISFAHEGNFADGIDGVARAKGELFQALAQYRGHGVINLDDERVVREAKKCDFKNQTTFSREQPADIQLIGHEPFSLATFSQSVTILVDEHETITFTIPLAGEHHAFNALLALAVIKGLGLSVSAAASGLKNMKKTKGRMDLFVTTQKFMIINDGYNANPASMEAGIMASKEIPAKRRIAAIGAMGELGEKSAEHHFRLGQFLASHFDQLFICGEDARQTVEGALAGGMHSHAVVYRNTSLELISPIKTYIAEGDLLFIKGSLSAKMETIAEAFAPAP